MLIFAFTTTVLSMILIPVILAAVFHRRYHAPWILFATGTITFLGSQIVHFPLNSFLTSLHMLPKTGVPDPSMSLIQTSLVLGFTAGLCEETARAVGYWLLKKFRSLETGFMVGIGHGGVESMIFGGVLTAATISSLAPMIGTDLSKLDLTADQLLLLKTQLQALTESPLLAAASPLLERLLAMIIHIILSVMVLQAFRRRRPFYFIAAIAYHMAFDSVAVYLSSKVTNHYLVFPSLILMILPGLVWLIFLWRKETHTRLAEQPFIYELRIFQAALWKESIQQWRTHRFLVVMAVFVLFGLTSPLLAYFMPKIIQSLPGVEQFSGLIPTPTTADAMAQYIKNITQFGFILAVLLGMNAVAGEKESGTAAMVLSKPIPRWSFLLSKFSAQSLMYLSSFMVAGAGAYYYITILFGTLDGFTFLKINLLLYLWLLTFVSAALLGSVIGSSIASAAGVGLGISVIILLAGNIPQFGMLLPGGLTVWASQLGSGSGQAAANAGSQAAAVVLIILSLVWSLALFENQEI